MQRRVDWDCARTRQALCRLAVGGTLDQGARELARHVQGCTRCDEHLDELAGLRRWLARWIPVASTAREDDLLELGARAAVVRELEARLARDLLPGSNGPRRGREDVQSDVRRRELLREASAVPPVLWRRARAALLEGAAELTAGERLELAVSLDRTGLDLALAWLAQLSRTGRHDHARREARRYLAHMEGVVRESNSIEDDR
jgi:hypothetical protein